MTEGVADYRAMMEIFAALNAYINPREPTAAQLAREKRWWNTAESIRLLFGIFQWTYLLLPIGIREVRSRYDYGNVFMIVKAHQLHIFGVRIARWVVGAEYHQTQSLTQPRVPLRRHRARRRGRRS